MSDDWFFVVFLRVMILIALGLPLLLVGCFGA